VIGCGHLGLLSSRTTYSAAQWHETPTSSARLSA
jgi:hypothetical protein